MEHTRTKAILIGLAVFAAVGAFSVYAASSYGSQEDPLITKSYLDAVVRPELENTLRETLENAAGELRGATGSFTPVTLSEGQILTGGAGTEFLLRSGRASAALEDDAVLVDTTDAAELSGSQALKANHLYMVPAAGGAVSAREDDTLVLVNGFYTLDETLDEE